MTDRKFRGKSENEVWLPLIESIMEGSNTAITIADGDDEKYCGIMCFIHDMLVPLYVDTEVMDIRDFNRLFYVFIYVLETVYGDPYSKEKVRWEKMISVRDYFNQIKKHWNDNISEEIKKYN